MTDSEGRASRAMNRESGGRRDANKAAGQRRGELFSDGLMEVMHHGTKNNGM